LGVPFQSKSQKAISYQFIKKISGQSQVVLVTHNQKGMEIADVLYGVIMKDKGGIKTGFGKPGGESG
jgi:chromosome segregation ATPase